MTDIDDTDGVEAERLSERLYGRRTLDRRLERVEAKLSGFVEQQVRAFSQIEEKVSNMKQALMAPFRRSGCARREAPRDGTPGHDADRHHRLDGAARLDRNGRGRRARGRGIAGRVGRESRTTSDAYVTGHEV